MHSHCKRMGQRIKETLALCFSLLGLPAVYKDVKFIYVTNIIKCLHPAMCCSGFLGCIRKETLKIPAFVVGQGPDMPWARWEIC